MNRAEKERLKCEALYAKQRELAGDSPFLIGVDEVGRGCVAGPLAVGAVVLPHEPKILGIKDSKKLSPNKRTKLAQKIRLEAIAAKVSYVSPAVIDKFGIVYALQYAMLNAIKATGYAGSVPIAIDGKELPALSFAKFIVKGDDSVAAISAASIVAKVSRDAVMSRLSYFLPKFAFDKNKGYGTQEHICAIQEFGLTKYHRKSFCGNFVKKI